MTESAPKLVPQDTTNTGLSGFFREFLESWAYFGGVFNPLQETEEDEVVQTHISSEDK